MRVLVTGGRGQVGRALTRLVQLHEWQALALSHAELDITDASSVQSAFDSFRPHAVVNAAAYTAVDRAESEPALALAVNRDGPRNLALACAASDVPLIHISTDYVFDGRKTGAYTEDDLTAPLNVYGESKLAGEKAVQACCSNYVILRTSWVFSAFGNNFVNTMLRLGRDREELAIVSDQRGCPTSATELARGIVHMLENRRGLRGVFHFCQPEPTTWYGFAKSIFEEAKSQGKDLKIRHMKEIATADYPTPAARPANSVLDCARFEDSFEFKIRPWKESLLEVLTSE